MSTMYTTLKNIHFTYSEHEEEYHVWIFIFVIKQYYRVSDLNTKYPSADPNTDVNVDNRNFSPLARQPKMTLTRQSLYDLINICNSDFVCQEI